MERVLTDGGVKIRVRASVLALWLYRLQFGEDLTRAAADYMRICERLATANAESDAGAVLEDLRMLTDKAPRIVWAMAKAQAYADNSRIVSWDEWLGLYGGLDFAELTADIVQLLIAGYYSDIKPAAKKGGAGKTGDTSDNVIIAGCKYMHLSHEEMNMLTLRGYIELADAYTADDAGVAKPAGQDDINGFFSM